MSNQAKRLSDCPAERLAHCRGEVVPPAGDVEVQRWEPENTIVGYNMKPTTDGSFVLHDHYFRDVTRLAAEVYRRHDLCVERTTERDEALAEVERLNSVLKLNASLSADIRTERDALQSELTKARELLRVVHTGELFGPEDWKMVTAFMNQSAPAAKREDPSCLLCLDEKTVAGPNAGDYVHDCPNCCGEEG